MPSMIETVLLIGASLLQTFGLRVGAEQPRYAVLEQSGPLEIRRYEPRIVAQTTITGEEAEARSQGFRRIAGYIFGDNQSGADIAMTSPVAQTRSQAIAVTNLSDQTTSGSGWTVQFVMPAKYRMDELPKPNEPSVHLSEVPAATYAVLRFSGNASSELVKRKVGALLAETHAQGRVTSGEPVVWFYDPPWTVPFLRRNEVAIELEIQP